jgi:hypothetical protein
MLIAIGVRTIRSHANNTAEYDADACEKLNKMANKAEEAYDDLYPFAPDVGDANVCVRFRGPGST